MKDFIIKITNEIRVIPTSNFKILKQDKNRLNKTLYIKWLILEIYITITKTKKR